MPNPEELAVSTLGGLQPEVLKQAKIELRMNLSLLEMLKGNTALEDLADLRERWVEPYADLINALQMKSEDARSRKAL